MIYVETDDEFSAYAEKMSEVADGIYAELTERVRALMTAHGEDPDVRQLLNLRVVQVAYMVDAQARRQDRKEGK